MDMKQLEFFVTACERGSLSKAAECLYTSQPNISKNIRRLERELGRPLLKRRGNQQSLYFGLSQQHGGPPSGGLLSSVGRGLSY